MSEVSIVTVVKLDPQGQVAWRYPGQVLSQDGSQIILEAYFDRDDRLFHGMPLYKGDRWLETYYTDRWYNILEIHSRADDALRGWYCNVSTPARLEGGTLSYHDLALDLLVFPDGRQIVLDEDEFAELDLSPQEREQALGALRELQSSFKGVAERGAR